MASSSWKLGVDVGGTFTDGVLYNEDSGEIIRAKVLSTPKDQSEGVLNVVSRLMSQAPAQTINISVMNHGTTIATNAILEGKGATVALLVTEGYKDILQVRRSQVPGGLAGWIVWPKPKPLAPLELTIEVPGRISSNGEVVRPLDEAELRMRLQKLKSLPKPPESITVSLMNSFANSIHEKEVASIVESEFPGIPLSLSHQVLPEIMEYERTVTTVANSYIKPVVGRYLENLQHKLGKTELRVLRSDGGLAGVNIAREQCANLLYSGPAGGVAGVVSHIARKTTYKNLLTFDMGGTSTDVCLVENGVPELRRESTIGDLTIRAPSIDVRTVGAGGGSIATVAEITGALRVGPESAGASPGPICYSKGGDSPTVTDALAVLGYLPPALLGGSFALDIPAAEAAIKQKVATPLGLSVHAAAEGIVKIAVEKMYGSLRGVSVEKGKDSRDFHLVAFGGAGPSVVCHLATLCGTSYPAIIPPSPGVLCAFGDAHTALRHEISCTVLRKISDISADEFRGMALDLQFQTSKVLTDQGVHSISQQWETDLRFKGQATSLPIPFVIGDLQDRLTILSDRFEAFHSKIFTFSLDLDIEIVNLRAIAIEEMKSVATAKLPFGSGSPSRDAIRDTTSIFYAGQAFHNVPIYERTLLKAGDQLTGPCIITETDSNTLIAPSHRAEIDEIGNVLIWEAQKANTSTQSASTVDPIIVQLIEVLFTFLSPFTVAMSPAMREQLDYFPMLAAGEGIHSGKMVCGQFGSFISGFLSSWDDTIEEGDVFLTNDPYSVSNSISHLNDFLVINPVFFDGKIVGWTANLGHFTDIGSVVPGSMPTPNLRNVVHLVEGELASLIVNPEHLPIHSLSVLTDCATSIYEDGIQIPLCKLYSRGVPNKAVFKAVERNSRKPDFAANDLHSLVAATKIAEKRILEMIERFGLQAYEGALDALLTRNRNAVGKLINSTIPSDPVYFEDHIDDDGFGVGPWRIACKMEKQKNAVGEATVLFDFEGTDPQSERSINLALSGEMLKMFIVFYLLTVFDPATVVNDGSFDLINLNIPQGTILNPIRPAALSCRTHLLGRLFDVIGALFGQRQPEFLSAAGFSDSPHFFYSGWTKEGEWFQLYQIGFGGVPARPHGDGPDGHSLWPSMMAVPNEFLESYLPLRIDRYETVPDSGGEGLYRGGNAMRIDYFFLEPGNISIHDDRWFTKPWGVNGGGCGQRSTKTLVRASTNERQLLRSKEDFVEVFAGDVLEWVTWGGGGWGNPLERSPELVALEVRQSLVKDTGRYGVVLKPTGEVDYDATSKLRTTMGPAQTARAQSLFNKGGSLKELTERCLEETGFPPPKLPSTRVLRGPVSRLQNVVKLHKRRAEEDKALFM
uniref:PI-PLC Y-box domain-containing protein n=1 Tax=Moniliophthora roreri TaxID=221103 RepID=A0A0W0FFU6_MONRR